MSLVLGGMEVGKLGKGDCVMAEFVESSKITRKVEPFALLNPWL
jgi:hypothetical protein